MTTEEIEEVFQQFFDTEDCYSDKFIEALKESLYALEKIGKIRNIIDYSEYCEIKYGIRRFSKESAYDDIVKILEG